MAPRERKEKFKVYLNVYDLVPQKNEYTMMVGLGGAFHTGVEVLGREYTYGGHGIEGETGVFENEPRRAVGAVYRETLDLGEAEMSQHQLNEIIAQLKKQFIGPEYHLLNHNCNTFSDAFCRALLGRSLPGYITRLSRIGSCCSCFLPRSWLHPQFNTENSLPSRTNQGRSFSFDRDTMPMLRSNSSSSNPHDWQPLAGVGYALSDSVGPRDEGAEARRERHAQAALARLQSQSSSLVHPS
eukprot:TRINITY_DN2520_c0_g1_i3.p1 TRINITY_DN2520_c0_g1~~TRINITY_DN2520_c0_g1_i3.p1  ORF type:complete len:269 (+),score=50.80 TRINITY_DN2520_c0_g1_i3:87-809(+)